MTQGQVAVGKVIADQSVSLDGFSAGPNDRIGNGMGDGGEDLHTWIFAEGGRTGRDGTPVDGPQELISGAGAVVVGRRMFDLGQEPWGDPPPFHGNPVFIVTHRPHAPIPMQGGTTYTFVTDGLDATLARAREAAGGKDVLVLGGANIVQQCLKGGHLDELHIHIAHLLLGGGTRFFGDLGAVSATLRSTRVVDAEGVTHLRFRLVK
jgi:dihydrofolate reductase